MSNDQAGSEHFIFPGSERIHRQERAGADDEVHGRARHTGGDRCKIIISVKSKLTATLFQDILDEADKDQNGLIDYKEFFDMMEPGRS